MRKVIVPQADIDRLEKARKALYKLFEDSQELYNLSYGITDIMYKITHQKYPEYGYRKKEYNLDAIELNILEHTKLKDITPEKRKRYFRKEAGYISR